MAKNHFDIEQQKVDLNSRLVVGFERIAEVFRVLLWNHAKELGLSPIQIQLLIFLESHAIELCTVSHLAREFNMTKPTISDAVKVLVHKELITKIVGSGDARSYSISLSREGRKILKQVKGFTSPLEKSVDHFDTTEKKALYQSMTKLIFQLHKDEIISVQRTCFACKFHEKRDAGHYCHFIREDLKDHEIRLDCSDFVLADSTR
ncbi:MAG: MarR family transcriptional regulator [Cyclobacteriaceae bacterium]